MRVAATDGGVERTTPERVNEMIRRETECSVLHYASRPQEIGARLAELDEEWPIERVLQAHAAKVVLAGLALSVVRGRKWLGLAALSGFFLLQHVVQGWCPPVAALRRAGVRTSREIEMERSALKALRGDFAAVSEGRDALGKAQAALRAAGVLRDVGAERE